MKINGALSLLAMLLAFACNHKKDEGVELKLHLPAGKSFEYNTDMVVEQTANEQKATTVLKVNLIISAADSSADSTKRLKAVYDRLARQEKTPTKDLKTDTETPLKDSGMGLTTPGQILNTLFLNMKGKSVFIHLDAADSIDAITGLEQTGEQIAAGLNLPENEKAAVSAAYRQYFSEEALKDLLMPAFAIYPGHKVKEGEQWQKTSAIKAMATINLNITTTYTLKSHKGSKAVVDINSKMGTGNVKGTQTGTATIDTDTGLVTDVVFEQVLSGEINAISKIKISSRAK
jgi:hypothetical protein